MSAHCAQARTTDSVSMQPHNVKTRADLWRIARAPTDREDRSHVNARAHISTLAAAARSALVNDKRPAAAAPPGVVASLSGSRAAGHRSPPTQNTAPANAAPTRLLHTALVLGRQRHNPAGNRERAGKRFDFFAQRRYFWIRLKRSRKIFQLLADARLNLGGNLHGAMEEFGNNNHMLGRHAARGERRRAEAHAPRHCSRPIAVNGVCTGSRNRKPTKQANRDTQLAPMRSASRHKRNRPSAAHYMRMNELLLTVIAAYSSTFSILLPVKSFGRMSTSTRCVCARENTYAHTRTSSATKAMPLKTCKHIHPCRPTEASNRAPPAPRPDAWRWS